ncbi:MAG TPA: S53 family peptidase [Kofleriaceae bacterium]
MRTSSRFDRAFADFAGPVTAVLGLCLGFVPSGCVADPGDGLVTGEAEQDLALRAQVSLDQPFENEIQTGSVCSGAGKRCFAHAHATPEGFVQAAATPQGFGPADLQAAYKIPMTITGSPIVAIVDAYGYPQLESDLAAYRTQYGLPACTVANGCLKIVNQTGGATLPAAPPANDDWTLETALDVDMASAACPSCKILVVQADDDQGNGLDIAQNAAATLGATVISNSWGGPEQAGTSLAGQEVYFNHPNIAVFVSAGDNGYNDAGQGPDYPATSAYTIAVGGTHLVKDTSARGWTETAWTSGGSACSLSITKPAYQTNSGCTFKATTDIAAVGDPQTGVAVYNSRNGGWTVVGGTSASSPLIAAIFAATGNGKQTSGSFVKDNAAKLYDVLSGTNGTCTNAILCHAGAGWDGPTGYGTPNATLLAGGSGGGGGTGSGGGTGMGTGSGSGGSNPDGGGASSGTSESNGDNAVEGGCNAGGRSSGLFGLALIGLAVSQVRRRRRA